MQSHATSGSSAKLGLTLLAVASTVVLAQPAHAQPVWTDIVNQTGSSSMLSGDYFEFNSSLPHGRKLVSNTSIGVYPNLTIPGLSSGTPATGGGWDPICYRWVGTPTQYLKSNYGTGVKGVGFLGVFGGGQIPYNNFGAGSSIFEAVFYHEQQCYNGGREYGFFYEPYGHATYVYWGTNENLPTVVQAQTNLPNVNPNTTYYYAMYPTGNSSSCGFQITVMNTSFTTIYSQWIGVNSYNYPSGSTITGADPGFCAAVTSSSGMGGYVSATTIYTPTIQNIPWNMNLNLQRLFVGK